jgi:hypothetical protein
MEWTTFHYIATGVAIIAGLLVIYGTYRVQSIKIHQATVDREQANTNKAIADQRLKIIQNEFDSKTALLSQAAKITTEISESISQQLIDNPSWLDRFMDETGVTYRASVYGKRIGHFFYEKRRIAKEAVDKVEEYLHKNESTQYCLLIDSGTTTYPVFQEITNRLHHKTTRELWRSRVCIVTNNIPGMQYLMKNGKDDPNDDYSELIIDCFLVPGKPLSVYAAITGNEARKWLLGLGELLSNWKRDDMKVEVLGFVTGNYMARHEAHGRKDYYPVARGEGHVEIKKTIVEISDEVFLLSPLMKFSFAGVDLLNRVNGFDIDRSEEDRAKQNPRRVKYEEIPMADDKKRTFFTTKRPRDAKFQRFSEGLYFELVDRYKSNSIVMPEFDIRRLNPHIQENPHLEIEREIPHDDLRSKYEAGIDIWDHTWVLENEQNSETPLVISARSK